VMFGVSVCHCGWVMFGVFVCHCGWVMFGVFVIRLYYHDGYT